jgi:hypothetical protein
MSADKYCLHRFCQKEHFDLRTGTKCSLRNAVSDKLRTLNNVQKSDNCLDRHVPLPRLSTGSWMECSVQVVGNPPRTAVRTTNALQTYSGAWLFWCPLVADANEGIVLRLPSIAFVRDFRLQWPRDLRHPLKHEDRWFESQERLNVCPHFFCV